MQRRTFVLSGLAPLALAACGGGNEDSAPAAATADSAPGADTLSSVDTDRLVTRGFRLLPPVGGTDSEALGINRAGDVVGFTGAGEAGDAGATVWSRRSDVRLPTLGDIGSGRASGINGSGAVVGNSTLSATASHATLWVEGRAIDLGVLGTGTASQARALNDAGLIVGWSYLTDATLAPAHAVLWRRGARIDLGTLGGIYSDAYAINASGVIVGTSTTAQPDGTHAVVWQRGTITRLADLGGVHSYARAVNDQGLIVGSSDLPGTDAPSRPVLWRRGTPIELESYGGIYASAEDINDAGLIVGWSYLPDNQATRAVLWVARHAIDLNRFLDAATRDAGWSLASANAINDEGRIAGSALNALTGARRGYVMSLGSRQ